MLTKNQVAFSRIGGRTPPKVGIDFPTKVVRDAFFNQFQAKARELDVSNDFLKQVSGNDTRLELIQGKQLGCFIDTYSDGTSSIAVNFGNTGLSEWFSKKLISPANNREVSTYPDDKHLLGFSRDKIPVEALGQKRTQILVETAPFLIESQKKPQDFQKVTLRKTKKSAWLHSDIDRLFPLSIDFPTPTARDAFKEACEKQGIVLAAFKDGTEPNTLFIPSNYDGIKGKNSGIRSKNHHTDGSNIEFNDPTKSQWFATQLGLIYEEKTIGFHSSELPHQKTHAPCFNQSGAYQDATIPLPPVHDPRLAIQQGAIKISHQSSTETDPYHIQIEFANQQKATYFANQFNNKSVAYASGNSLHILQSTGPNAPGVYGIKDTDSIGIDFGSKNLADKFSSELGLNESYLEQKAANKEVLFKGDVLNSSNGNECTLPHQPYISAQRKAASSGSPKKRASSTTHTNPISTLRGYITRGYFPGIKIIQPSRGDQLTLKSATEVSDHNNQLLIEALPKTQTKYKEGARVLTDQHGNFTLSPEQANRVLNRLEEIKQDITDFKAELSASPMANIERKLINLVRSGYPQVLLYPTQDTEAGRGPTTTLLSHIKNPQLLESIEAEAEFYGLDTLKEAVKKQEREVKRNEQPRGTVNSQKASTRTVTLRKGESLC